MTKHTSNKRGGLDRRRFFGLFAFSLISARLGRWGGLHPLRARNGWLLREDDFS